MTRHALVLIASLTGLLLSTSAWAGNPMFDLSVDALDPQACGGSGCWTNHLRVTDIDGDGDLDILLANYPDFFGGGGGTQPLVVYRNDGNASFTNVSSMAVDDYSGSLRMIAVGDVNGDGAVDIYGPQGNGGAHVLFINDGTGVFTDEADTRLAGIDFPNGAAARMGDVDGDGDLDIFAADGYAVAGPPFGHIYLNDGTGTFTEAAGAIPGSISGEDIDDVEFFDADRDFDLDLVVNAHGGGIGALWLNDGSGVFTAGGSLAPPGAGSNFHYNVVPCDVDGDGDLDLWIDNTGGGYTEQLQINDGNGNFTDETASRVAGNPGSDDNGVICADVDNDGDLDGVVVSLGTAERLLQNDGAGNFTYIPGAFPPPTDCSLWGEFGDLNGDGRLDLVMGQGECSSSDEVYIGNALVDPDSLPPVIIAVDAPASAPAGTEPVVLFAVSDNTVTDEGPRLDRAFAVIDPGGAGETIVDGWFIGGDLFRVELPAADSGPITFQVCAEDRNANIGCSEEMSYDIGDEPPGTDSSGGGVDSTAGDPDTSGGAVTDGNTSGVSATGNDPTGGSDGTETSPASDGGGDGGCGCRQEPGQGSAGFAALGLLGLLGLRRRRRA